MTDILAEIWSLLGVPQVWGGILTVAVLAIGVLLKQLIENGFAAHLKMIEALHAEDVWVREQYADIKLYSTEQAQGLRDAYLLLFESNPSTSNIAEGNLDEQLDVAIEMVMKPLRIHLVILDESTKKKIHSIQNYLWGFKGSARPDSTREELINEGGKFWRMTEDASKFVTPDQIAYRLGLISSTLEDRRQGRT